MTIWDAIESYMLKQWEASRVPASPKDMTREATIHIEYEWSVALTKQAHDMNPTTAVRADYELLAELTEIIHGAVKMTPEQQEEQRRSFAFGNTKLSNNQITKEMVDAAAEATPADYYGTPLILR